MKVTLACMIAEYFWLHQPAFSRSLINYVFSSNFKFIAKNSNIENTHLIENCAGQCIELLHMKNVWAKLFFSFELLYIHWWSISAKRTIERNVTREWHARERHRGYNRGQTDSCFSFSSPVFVLDIFASLDLSSFRYGVPYIADKVGLLWCVCNGVVKFRVWELSKEYWRRFM